MENKLMAYSSSEIQTFADCPLKHFLKYEQHLHKIEQDSHVLAYGNALHRALSVYYHREGLQKAQDEFVKAYPVQLDPSDLARTMAHGVILLEWYDREYSSDFKRYQILANEERAETEDGLVVVLDLVVKDRETDCIFAWDHKTTGAYLNYDWYTRFEPNSQVTQYVRYVKSKYQHCDGMIINAISQRFRQRASKDGPAGFWTKFERQIFNRNQSQIDQDTASKDYWVAQIEQAKASGLYGMNTGSCKFCEYRGPCSQGWVWPQDADLFLTQYQQTCDMRVTGTGDHCSLELNHEGEHKFEFPAVEQPEFEITV